MSSRETILSDLRRQLPQAAPLPDDFTAGIRYDDPLAQFLTVLAAIGGTGHLVQSLAEIPPLLGDLAGPDRCVVSAVPGLLDDRFDLSAVTDPHQLQGVDLAILPGELAVAENAAVWVTDRNVSDRVLYFLSQHVALVVPRASLVHNLHEAYERITVDASPFGCFLAGPSKTADIEQSLVQGAHGARTLNLFFLADPADGA